VNAGIVPSVLASLRLSQGLKQGVKKRRLGQRLKVGSRAMVVGDSEVMAEVALGPGKRGNR
jgi:hypothetical protein